MNPLQKPPTAAFLYGYTYTGFATLQKAVDDFILSVTAAAHFKTAPQTTVSLGLMPQTAYHTDSFHIVVGIFLALFFILSFLYPFSRFVR
jgi:hypothetical protein